MQELIEKIGQLAVRQNELEAALAKWKENSGTITVEKVVEKIVEVPVEVIKEVEKIVEPDTTELEAKVSDLTAKLEEATAAIGALTSVAPVVEKVEEAVTEAVVDAVAAPEPTPAADAFVAEPTPPEAPADAVTE